MPAALASWRLTVTDTAAVLGSVGWATEVELADSNDGLFHWMGCGGGVVWGGVVWGSVVWRGVVWRGGVWCMVYQYITTVQTYTTVR
jgi:hypothetical protein